MSHRFGTRASERNSTLTRALARKSQTIQTDLDRHTGGMISQREEHSFPKQALKAGVELDF